MSACLSGHAPQSSEAALPSSAPHAPSSARFEAGTGVIEGRVVDPELVPIAAANVQIVPPKANPTAMLGLNGVGGALEPITLSTDTEGRFVASGLEPGTYLVYASKYGYEDAAPHRTAVGSDETVRLRITLLPLAVPEPYHLSTVYKSLHDYASVHAASAYADIPAGSNRKLVTGERGFVSSIDFQNNETDANPLATIVFQQRWTSGTPLCKAGTRVDVYAPEEPPNMRYVRPVDPLHWTNAPDVQNPTRLEIPREGPDPGTMHSANRTELNHGRPIETAGAWFMEMRPAFVGTLGIGYVDASCMVEQSVENWLSVFYGDPSPPRWSVFGDA
jgi:hypothetical protein